MNRPQAQQEVTVPPAASQTRELPLTGSQRGHLASRPGVGTEEQLCDLALDLLRGRAAARAVVPGDPPGPGRGGHRHARYVGGSQQLRDGLSAADIAAPERFDWRGGPTARRALEWMWADTRADLPLDGDLPLYRQALFHVRDGQGATPGCGISASTTSCWTASASPR